ncbi:HVO_2922 family protein [Halovivax cerinus]|uniref:HVO_2922 family protein n=1 Tax=Halovivax cerinus TaxID=1487865 RepID=A0ABD5NKL8_9EURY|nr:HVO_2922 family protein [Halovivax cerinus]
MVRDRCTIPDEDGEHRSGSGGVQVDESIVADGGDTESKARFELYRDGVGEWRWRLVHDNGNIIADSGEGYDRKDGARRGLESVKRNAPGARVVLTDS